MATTQDIVSKLWNLCNTLRDDGITYQQYVTELTYLLFLKMMQETGHEDELPEGYRWEDVLNKGGTEQLDYYRTLLIYLGNHGSKRVRDIFAGANTSLRQPKNLSQLIAEIDQLDWFSAKEEGLGNLYEGLLEKNASELKSGAGQYFTPRPLIDSIVHLIKPQMNEVVQDPAAGTAGFLVTAWQYLKESTDDFASVQIELYEKQRTKGYVGMELVPDTHRLALMNCMLHDLEADLRSGDTLSEVGKQLPKVDIVITNPPFGTKKGGGGATRDDFTFETSNKQLAFLQHIYRALKPGGRAAVVLPDNVLFEDNVGAQIRTDLMHKCNLHTILRLPTGIFYAQGVKTNVFFFQAGRPTDGVWVYDMRTNMPTFGKRTPLTREHFKDFETCFGTDPNGNSFRQDMGDTGRYRYFTREQLRVRGDNLDISWLLDESFISNGNLPDPIESAEESIIKLGQAINLLEEVIRELKCGEGKVL
ncbi:MULTISPECIES: class I SAM-dependent DNA methyltransferase [unclassified Paenibacillus]|uniref:class I SAM-dependent DNA methyltransferase n=1 Tax=unclassified Paenibacillus TaxID=185978 RepID=UPI00362A34BD